MARSKMTYKWMSLYGSRSCNVGLTSLSQTMDGMDDDERDTKETEKPACIPYIPPLGIWASFPSAIRDDTTLTRSRNEAGNTPE